MTTSTRKRLTTPEPLPELPGELSGWRWNAHPSGNGELKLIAPDAWETRWYQHPDRALAEARRRVLSTPKAAPAPAPLAVAEPAALDGVVMMSESEARDATAQIRAAVDGLRTLIATFDEREGWKVLGYQSFADWAAAEIPDTSLRHIYRLRAAADVDRSLGRPIGHTPESHARELFGVAAEERPAVLAKAADIAGDRPVTAKDIRAAIDPDAPLAEGERFRLGAMGWRPVGGRADAGGGATLVFQGADGQRHEGTRAQWRAVLAGGAPPPASADLSGEAARLARYAGELSGEAARLARYAGELLDDAEQTIIGSERWRECLEGAQSTIAGLPAGEARAALEARAGQLTRRNAAAQALVRATTSAPGSIARGEALIEAKAALRMLDPGDAVLEERWRRLHAEHGAAQDAEVRPPGLADSYVAALVDAGWEPTGRAQWRGSVAEWELRAPANAGSGQRPTLWKTIDGVRAIIGEHERGQQPPAAVLAADVLRAAGWRARPDIPLTWIAPGKDADGKLVEVTFDDAAEEARAAELLAADPALIVEALLAQLGGTVYRAPAEPALGTAEPAVPSAPAAAEPGALPADIAALVAAYGLLTQVIEDGDAWYFYWPGEADELDQFSPFEADDARDFLRGVGRPQLAANAPESVGARLMAADGYIETATPDGRLNVVWASGARDILTLAELAAELDRAAAAAQPPPTLPAKPAHALATALTHADDAYVLTLIREVAGGGETAASDEATQLRRALVSAARAWAKGRVA